MSILIRDLEHSKQLDSRAASRVRGGNARFKAMGLFANVDVDINQNIVQVQDIEVNALNNIGFIGAGFGTLELDISPRQFASTRVAV